MVDQININRFLLDGKRMNVVETAPNGVVNKDTIFIFSQFKDRVFAKYTGGKIKKGFLEGKIKDGKFRFDYVQVDILGNEDSGQSICDIEELPDGRIRLIEHFEWKSRPRRKGTNIFEEIPGP